MRLLPIRALWSLACLAAAGCGAYEQKTDQTSHRGGSSVAANSGDAAKSSDESPRLAQADTDQVLGTLVIPFGKDGLSLADSDSGVVHWVVDMEEKEDVKAGVAPQKYLKVKGDLQVPMDADNKEYEVGCIYVELKDNVYYREQTWLRLSTSGIHGKTYSDVRLPLSVDLGGWQPVPDLPDSVSITHFAGNTIKKFTGTLCFKLDFTDAPAQQYEGELIVQYLRPGTEPNPPACTSGSTDPACQPATGGGDTTGDDDGGNQPEAFACAVQPLVLKAKQQATLSWSGIPAGASLEVKLATDTTGYTGGLGSLTAGANGSYVYTAPDKVPATARILATARVVGIERLPTFCQVNLTADEDIGVPDDGEIQGLPGNVYRLPANTQKLPDLSAMTPVDHIVASNLDVPNRIFSSGFPGVKDMDEWFAIRFRGQLLVPADQTCAFKLTADDGAILTIDGNVVVNNDGVHAVQDKVGSATLKKGAHAFNVDYFQGPRQYIALQLFWKCGSASDYTIVPPAAFTRPLE